MFKFSKWSLKTKLITMVSMICFLISAGSFLTFKKFADYYKSQVEHKTAELASDMGQRIGAQFYERYGDIQAFAMNPEVKKLNSKVLTSYLDEYVKLYGMYDVILVVDKNGQLVAANSKDTAGNSVNLKELEKSDFSNDPWFKNAWAEQWTEDKTNGFSGTFFEDIHVDPMYQKAFGQTKTGASFSSVIKNEKGEKVGVITNRASNKWIEYEFANLYKQLAAVGKKDAEISLINKEGLLIVEFAPKRHNFKEVFESDLKEKLFKENFFQTHSTSGPLMAQRKDGAERSRPLGEDADDLVAHHFISNSKWISDIGWTVVIHNDYEDSVKEATASINNFYLISAMIAFIAIAISVWFGFLVSKSISKVTEVLTHNSAEVSDASKKIASQATELSESATEQAAALQETVAAVDEISAMVEKNSEAAVKSKEVSAQSREAAVRGRQTVENMISAISEISSSNDEISFQMDQSNRQLAEITKLINDIGSKTKVINEIVFQTKLLSFNASVEAARAGEYGKGFAVVAQEVGNLAQMSGNAAKEITEMLDQSVRQVDTIINDTKSKVERLMLVSKEKVSLGSETAKDCNVALEEILQNVSSVDNLVSEIAVASQEQSTGIREISKAVGQMEEVTQQNSSVAQSSSASAEQLSSQSSVLNGIVNSLADLVHGESSDSNGHNVQAVNVKVDAKKSRSNVVHFKTSENKSDHRQAERSAANSSEGFKKVSGSDFVPSSDDPGFES